MTEEVFNTLLGVIVGSLLTLITSLFLDYLKERRNNKRFLTAISAELGYNHQIFKGMNSNNIVQNANDLRKVVWDRVISEGKYHVLPEKIRPAYNGFYLGLVELIRKTGTKDKLDQIRLNEILSLRDQIMNHYSNYFKKKSN